MGGPIDKLREMCAERVRLQARLVAHEQWNRANATIDELTDAEVNRVETAIRLREVEDWLKDYVNQGLRYEPEGMVPRPGV